MQFHAKPIWIWQEVLIAPQRLDEGRPCLDPSQPCLITVVGATVLRKGYFRRCYGDLGAKASYGAKFGNVTDNNPFDFHTIPRMDVGGGHGNITDQYALESMGPQG